MADLGSLRDTLSALRSQLEQVSELAAAHDARLSWLEHRLPAVEAAVGIRLRRECSWCGNVLDEGTPGAQTSHGCCPACCDRLLRDARIEP